MPTSRRASPPAAGATRTQRSSRNKRADIIATATGHFGEHGYEDTKWADVAKAVGIGSTALYHYFESKLHCLYVIMAEALESIVVDFERITKEHGDYRDALLVVLRSGYELTEQQVLRNRVLVAEQGLLGSRRDPPREEEARQLARARTRDLELAWATFLVRGMEQGVVPEADPRLLTRAVLGLNTSVWHWYRPRESVPLGEVAHVFIRAQLAVLGVSPELAAPPTDGGVAARTRSTGSARASGGRRSSGSARPRPKG